MICRPLQRRRQETARIVAIYAVFGLAWIYGSDTLLGWLVHDPVAMVKIAVVKGWLFILCTATLLYFLINRLVQQLATAERGRIEASLQDIAERKRSEEVLRESRAKLEAALASMTDAVFISDIAGQFVDFNDAFATFHRFRSKSDCARTFAEYPGILDVFLPDGELAPVEMWAVPRALRGETATNAEYTLRRKDTGETWVGSYSFSPIRDKDGVIVGSVVVGRDITDRKRAETALKESEERWKFALEGAGDGLWDWNAVTNRVYYSRQWKTMLGYADDEIGDTLDEWDSRLHPEDRAAVYTDLERHFRGETQTYTNEYRMLCRDGSYKWILDRGKVIEWTEGGEPHRVIGIHTDISDNKRAEEEKAKLEAQLLQAQKMESVGRLAGGVAHDFNNLLTVILGHAELALMKMDPSGPFSQDLTAIRDAAVRSADLTQQLLAFARKQTIAPKVLDMNATVASMLKMLQRLIGEDILLNWHPAASLWQVKVDPAQLDQILANLSVNARDAIADVGKITIETRNSVFDTDYCAANFGFIPGEYVMLAVSDDGCGMDKETMLHIFEPFFTTKDLGEGTGLGLATVYGIVKQNRGFIKVYSEPGQGTTFKIYLPRYEGEGSPVQVEVAAKQLSMGNETILLVEDESSILTMTTLLLERQGYNVLSASKPSEAILLAQKHADGIHLLLTDVVMPDMNGRDLARALLPLCPKIKTLFMSGYTANVVAHHGVLDEDVHFISKPFSLPDLAAKVREVLDS